MSDLFINSSFSAKEKPMQVRHLLTAWLLTAAGAVLLMGIVANAQHPYQERGGHGRAGPPDPSQKKTQEAFKKFTVGQFEVGQRWEYEHEGPRPGAVKTKVIDGRRILQVVSQVEQDGQTLWVIEERFTHDPNVVVLLYVDDTGMLRSLDGVNKKGEATRLTYEPAIVYQAMAMEVGEQKTLETKLLTEDGNFAMPITMEVSRLEDEAVVTAAGRLEACRHFEVVTKSLLDLKVAKIPIKETRQRWYSEEVSGLVKEVYEKGPGKFLTWSWEGYTSTSTLVSFGVEEVDANTLAAAESAAGSGQRQNRGADRPMIHLTLIGVLVALFAGICIAGGILVARRLR